MRLPEKWLSRLQGASSDRTTNETPAAPAATHAPSLRASAAIAPRPSSRRPGAPRPREALDRLKATLFRREVDTSVVVPGIGSVTERPVRHWPEPSQAEVDADSSPTLRAQALRDRLAASPPGLWERPARTRANRFATTLVPWLKPRPLAGKASIGEAEAAAFEPLEVDQLDLLERRHDDALAVLEIAHAQSRDADGVPTSDASRMQRQRQAATALAAAELRAGEARRALATAASAAALQPGAAQVLGLEQQAAHVESQRDCLADVESDLDARRDALLARVSVDGTGARALAALAALDAGVAAALEARHLLSRQPDPAAEAAQARAQFARLESRALEIQARLPAGFGPDSASAPFGQRLLAAVRARPANPSADALPAIALMEIASRAIARVAGGDGARADRLLQALRARSSLHWLAGVPDDADPAAQPSTEADVRELWRLASGLPRGAEVLHLLGAPGSSMPDGLQLQAARTFWSADAAQRREPDRAVRRWLAGAKRVARGQLEGAEPVEPRRDVDEASFNAVRNGCLSNAAGTAYDQHDRRLRKATEEWLARVQAPVAGASTLQRITPGRRVARALAPNHRKSPYTARALATDIAESFGMTTQRRVADEGTRAAAARLAQWAEGDLAPVLERSGLSAADAAAFVAATSALAAHALAEAHPSTTRHDERDAGRVRADAYERLRPPRQPGEPRVLLKPHRGFAVAPPFDELLQQPGTSLDKLRALADYLKLTVADVVDASSLAPLAHDPHVHAAADDASRPSFRSAEDVVRYFEPLLRNMQLRDRLKLTGGGTVGAGLPSLPYSVASPVVSPLFSAGLSRKDEAFIMAFMPILGMELSVGGMRTTAGAATLGVAAGPELPGVAKFQATATQKLSRTHAATRGTVLRLLRTRGHDDEMRAEMLGVLDTWFRWEQHRDADGQRYRGPLEAVLARHPKISLGEIEADSTSRAGTTRVGAGAGLALPGGAGETNKLSANVALNFKAERIADRRSEQGGHVRVRADAGDTAQQKFSAEAQLNLLLPANGESLSAPGVHAGGALSGGGVPGVLDLTRDIAWMLEKHSVSPFLVGDKQDADLDRHYGTPADMLAEIRHHRDAWLARCAQTLPAGDARANRDAAELLLRQFEARLSELGKTSRLCQYNVNYSMRPQASSWIDGFRALEALASPDSDAEAARDHLAAANQVMQQASTWRPLMLIVREKGREAQSTGINFLAQVQANVGVEGQRTAAQFPPP